MIFNDEICFFIQKIKLFYVDSAIYSFIVNSSDLNAEVEIEVEVNHSNILHIGYSILGIRYSIREQE